jgi:deazaflavin-dependent oxidoreductase (nitroreductase family)
MMTGIDQEARVHGTAERKAGGTLRWANRLVVRAYRATGGRVLGTDHGLPVLLLTTVGRQSGMVRTTPVVFVRDAQRFLVTGTNHGRARRPSWCRNLLAEPSARVEIGAESWEVRAVSTAGAERDRLWELMVRRHSVLTKYLGMTDRVFPVFVLEPVS